MPTDILDVGHVGAHEHLGAFNPFQVFSQISDEGILVGRMEGNQPFFVDFHLWVARGYCMGTSVKFIGRRGGGKTAAMQTIAERFSNLRAGPKNKRRRITAEIIRRNAGVSEYDKFAAMLGVKSHDMAKISFNMLDHKFNLSDLQMYNFTRPALEKVGNLQLTSKERRVLKAGFYLMLLEDRESSSIPVLNHYVSTLDIEEYKKYCITELEDSLKKLNLSPEATNRLATRRARKLNINEDQLANACEKVSELLALFIEEHGETFNGSQSLADLLSDEAVILDCTSLSEETSSLVEMLLWNIRSAAVARYDRTFMADCELHDEVWKRYDIPIYGEQMVRHLKMIRGSGAVIMQAWHRPSDINQIKEAGRAYARTSFRETDVWFIFKLDRADAEEMRQYVPITDTHVEQIVNFNAGDCLVIIGDTFPPFRVHFDLQPEELEMIETNTASLVMASAA